MVSCDADLKLLNSLNMAFNHTHLYPGYNPNAYYPHHIHPSRIQQWIPPQHPSYKPQPHIPQNHEPQIKHQQAVHPELPPPNKSIPPSNPTPNPPNPLPVNHHMTQSLDNLSSKHDQFHTEWTKRQSVNSKLLNTMNHNINTAKSTAEQTVDQIIAHSKSLDTINNNINTLKSNEQQNMNQILLALQGINKKLDRNNDKKTAEILELNHYKSKCESLELKNKSLELENKSLRSALIEIMNYYQNPKPRLHLKNNIKMNNLEKILSNKDCKKLALETGKERYKRCIKRFIDLNQDNTDYPKVQRIENSIKQSEIIELYNITNNERIPKLNGQRGVRACSPIDDMTVIGEYTAKLIMESDFDDIYYGTKEYFQINEYAFNDTFDVDTDKNTKTQFDQSLFDMEPQRKRRKLNDDHDQKTNQIQIQTEPRSFTTNNNIKIEPTEIKMDENKNRNRDKKRKRGIKRKRTEDKNGMEVSHSCPIIIDGINAENQSILCFVNDIRRDITVSDPTEEDLEYKNVEFVKVLHYGLPKVYIVTTREIEEGEEIMSYFGAAFFNTIIERERFQKVQEMKRNDVNAILKKHNVTDINV